METSETTGAIAAALAKAHLEIDNPELDGVNPHFKSKFSTLAAVLNAVRKPLASQGIAMMQSVSIDEGRVAVTTSLIHASGEWLRETMAFPVANNANIQQAGSLVTYIRRYSLIALCGIVGDPHEDDDGDGDRLDRNEPRKPAPRTTRDSFRPENARGAAPVREERQQPPAKPAPAPEPSSPVSGQMDKYPDEGIVTVDIKRVVPRGKGHAVHVHSPEHGGAWFRTLSAETADYLKDQVGNTIRVELMRVDVNTIDILRVIAEPKDEGAKGGEDDLPF